MDEHGEFRSMVLRHEMNLMGRWVARVRLVRAIAGRVTLCAPVLAGRPDVSFIGLALPPSARYTLPSSIFNLPSSFVRLPAPCPRSSFDVQCSMFSPPSIFALVFCHLVNSISFAISKPA
jgi:hypothetical protein